MSCSPNRYLRTWQPPRGTLLVRKLKLGPDTPLAECIRIFKTWQAIPFKRKFYYTYVDVVKQKLKSKKKGNYSKMVKTTTVIFSRAR